jgi:ankyrin repeat protein
VTFPAGGRSLVALLMMALGGPVQAVGDSASCGVLRPLSMLAMSADRKSLQDFVGERLRQAEADEFIAKRLYRELAGTRESYRAEVKAALVREEDDCNHLTALEYAVAAGNIAAAEFLLDNGADPNALGIRGANPAQFRTRTILMRCLDLAANSHTRQLGIKVEPSHRTRALQLLIDRGADVNARDAGGETALHICTDIDALTIYLAKGANPSVRGYGGYTALDRHVFQAVVSADERTALTHLAVAKLLVAKGANNSIEDGAEPAVRDICATRHQQFLTEKRRSLCKEFAGFVRAAEGTFVPLGAQ